MQRLEVSGAIRPIYGSLGVKRLMQTLRICMGLVLMYLQLILTPYANEWFSFNVNTLAIPNVCRAP